MFAAVVKRKIFVKIISFQANGFGTARSPSLPLISRIPPRHAASLGAIACNRTNIITFVSGSVVQACSTQIKALPGWPKCFIK